jgi:hypothetical protein
MSKPYSVEVENGWSYVRGGPPPKDSGPWRYEWEAQEYADELNAMANIKPFPAWAGKIITGPDR